MLVDTVTIIVKAGDGGNGAVSLRRTAMTAKGGPDGGNGGNGGNVYVRGSNNLRDLRQFRFKKKIIAENGVPGKGDNLFGKNADHLIVYVPIGTMITDLDTGQVFEITDTTNLILIASGGKGGRGNVEFKTPINQTPRFAEKGTKGEAKRLLFNLKLIADIGLVGLPNAGKSSLLSVLTNATPAIGSYPFTTLEPNLGMFGVHSIADIPGLIEGASTGKGLGIQFLKHIEKTQLIVHCIDAGQTDPEKNYEIVRQEFQEYNPVLLTKPEIILLTKTDTVDASIIKKYALSLKKKKKTVLSISIYDEKSIEVLKKILQKLLN